MAGWPAKKNAAFTVVFPIYDNDGDLVTAAASLDSEVSKDKGTFTDCTNEATELATSSGMYYLDLTATEMNADIVAVITKTSTTDAKTAPNVIYTSVRQIDDLAYPTTSGRSIDVAATGEVGIDLDNVNGTLDAAEIGADAITAAKLAADAVNEIADQVWDETRSGHVAAGSFGEGVASVQGSLTGSVGSVTGNVGGNVSGSVGSIAAGGIAASSFAAGAIDAAAIATDAIGAAELAADAALEIADALLKRDIDQVEATMALHSLGTAILKAVSRIVDDAGTLKLYRTDGSTLHMSQAITTNPGADPIDELAVGS